MSRRVLFAVAGVAAAGMLVVAAFVWNSGQPANGQDRDQFAQDRGGAEAKPVAFDGARAMGYLKAICAIGPRMSGTENMEKQQALITKHFEGLGAKVTAQTFKATQKSRPQPVTMTNLIV